ncbi:hypothetical protein AC578_729 [Pseudocercospora eumusae]|uniref:Uncharacterized protein n=1 Tax=Pseudocercospora eumusae TaxID=321146 RepID=A0A139HMX2_9PEZI|nr:hypothetical protein AC578_729 [Pseudocercospora eumusae]
MFSSTILHLTLLVALINPASAKSAVVDATSKDLTSLVKRHSVTLVKSPKYEDAATFLAGLNLHLALAQIGCNKAPEKCSDIHAYLTKRLYYSWLQIISTIVSFMTNGTYPKERTSR